jgi:integrase
MAERLSQASVHRAMEKLDKGGQLYDAQVPGLRLVRNASYCSFKYVGRINDGSKRYISFNLGRCDLVSLRNAREQALQVKMALARGDDPRAKKVEVPDVRTALLNYLDSRGKDLSPRTTEWYSSMVNGPLKGVGRVPMDKITRDQVKNLHERITRDSGPYQANAAMRVMRLLHRDVARVHDLPPNPVSRAVRFNKEKPRQDAIAPEQLPDTWASLDAMDDPIRRTAWLVAFLTGLRSADVKGIRWEHLDQDGVLLVSSPKGGEDRQFQLPLPRYLLERLEGLRQYTVPLSSPFMFPAASRTGHIATLRKTDVWPHNPHTLRHTFRTVAMEAGVTTDLVSVLMNHRSMGSQAIAWRYVTRANLLGPMREAMEVICSKFLTYRR